MKYWASVLCLFASSFLGVVRAQTQEVNIIQIPGASGISLGKINDIVQDKYGFIWLVDQINRSLIRYDGSTMKRYTYDEKNPDSDKSLGGIGLECLFADKDGMIWIGGGMGIDRLDPITETFTHYKVNSDDEENFLSGLVTKIVMDHLGNLWVGTGMGLVLLNQETGTFTRFVHDPEDSTSLSDYMVRALYEDREGNLWVGTGWDYAPDDLGGLNLLNRETNTFTHFLHDKNDPHSLVENKIRSLFEDSKGNFWVGTRGGLHLMDRASGTFTRIAESGVQSKLENNLSGWITGIAEDKEGRLWIGTLNKGISRYDPATGQVSSYNNGNNLQSIWNVVCAKDGMIWVSTEKDFRLFKIDSYQNKIETVDEDLTVIQKESETVWWMGSKNGLIRKDIEDGSIRQFRNRPGDKNSLSNNKVTALEFDHEGFLWVGTEKGLNKYNPATGVFTNYLAEVNRQEDNWRNNISSIYEDSRQNLWVTTYYGLGLFRKGSDSLVWYVNSKSPESISSDQVGVVNEDANNNIWIGYLKGGINRYDYETDKFHRYLTGFTSFQLDLDHNNVLWAGTWSGLYSYDPELDSFEPTAIQEHVSSVIEDVSGNLWICASQGLYKISENRDQISLYGAENGFDKTKAMGNSYLGPDGELIFIKEAGGYYVVDPDKLYVPKDTASLYFTNFWIGNEVTSASLDGPMKKPIKLVEEIELTHDQNIFAFTFTKVDFRATPDDEILYIMENYDQEWRRASAEEKIGYAMVPPGKYSFRIKSATNGNGIWVEKGISITVLPPWYTTWWAYWGYGFIAIFGLVAVDSFQRRRIREQAKEEARVKELEQAREIEKAYKELKSTQDQLIQSEKMASLGELTAGIAHEIQNPLNFVNNFSEVNSELIDELNEEAQKGNLKDVIEIASNIKENETKINYHGKRADAIVKGMLQHSRNSSGVKEETDINALCDEYLRLAYHGLRAKDKSFNASMKTELDEKLEKIKVVPQEIGRVILNLITNAFYAVTEKRKEGIADYTPEVIVSTRKNQGTIEINVSDNGNGIPKDIVNKIFQPFFTTKPTGQGTGLGLSMSYDIVKAHGGELKLETKSGVGSTFTIVIPA